MFVLISGTVNAHDDLVPTTAHRNGKGPLPETPKE
jgi:hypothetical protein